MKILCTTDFSKCSINAIRWAVDFAEQIGGAEIEILHVLDIRGRSDMFLNLDEVLRESAEEDMDRMSKDLESRAKLSKINTVIFKASVKQFIPQRARKTGADLIILGTKGLSNLKAMTVGSVTDYLARHTDIPILSIPDGYYFEPIKNIVLGVDKEVLNRPDKLSMIHRFFNTFSPKVHFVQVNSDKDDLIEFDFRLQDQLGELEYDHKMLQLDDSIASTINDHADLINADLLCMIHRKRNWFANLFHHSVMRDELYNLELPFLIIPD